LQPVVSLITVYYNTPDDVAALCDSIGKFLTPQTYEHIVVDNASARDLSASLGGVKYVRLPRNVGFGAGCNRGAEIASAPVLLFVNPDCELVEDCVTPLLALMDRSAVAGPRVIYPDGMLQLSFGPQLSIGNEVVQRRRMLAERQPRIQNWIRSHDRFHPDYVSGCALMVRADDFRLVGGFDEEFFIYHEDVDLCKRIRDRGGVVTYAPSTRIVHKKGQSMRKEPDVAMVEYRRSQLHYYRKHHGWLQNRILELYLALRRGMA